jgi:hypothetical protein
MAIPLAGAAIAGLTGAFAGTVLGALPGPIGRHVGGWINEICPNEIPDPTTLIDAYRKEALTDDQMRKGLHKLGYSDQAIDAMLEASKAEFTPAELLRARERGVLSEEQFKNGLERLGYDDAAAGAMWDATRQIINPTEALKLKRLGQISEEEYNDVLKKNGLSPEMMEQWEGVNQYVPNPQDMVRFAVREALSPDEAERLGLYKDIPPAFLEEAKKIGLTEEDARKYWASHWELPGPSQVIDMYQRGILGDPDSAEAKQELSDFLKVADYSPYWRDKIQQLSWNPYTRIDGSRMFLKDAISEDELYENYRKLGYDDEHARNLVDYYKAQKETAAKAAAEKAAKSSASAVKSASSAKGQTAKDKDISLSLIKNAYYYGELDRVQALGLVQTLDYEPWEAELTVSVWDAQLKVKDKKDEINVLELKYQKGVIGQDEFYEELAKLDLKATAIDIIKLKNISMRKTDEKLPTRADLQRWLKKGFIDVSFFQEYMTRLNYSDEIAYLYYQDIAGKGG